MSELLSHMESYQQHIEFLRNYCAHYAPKRGDINVDYCALGCGASEAMKKASETGEPNMTPCIGGHKASDALALCPKWKRHSMESAEKYADDIRESLERMEVVTPVVRKWRMDGSEPRGKARGNRMPQVQRKTAPQPIVIQRACSRKMRNGELRGMDGVNSADNQYQPRAPSAESK